MVALFLNSCPTDLPQNAHVSVDFLRRATGFAATKLLRLLAGIGSLGFHVRLRDEERDEHNLATAGQIVELEWHDMSAEDEVYGNATAEAEAMLSVGSSGFCAEHALEALLSLNFSQLAAATRTEEHRGAS